MAKRGFRQETYKDVSSCGPNWEICSLGPRGVSATPGLGAAAPPAPRSTSTVLVFGFWSCFLVFAYVTRGLGAAPSSAPRSASTVLGFGFCLLDAV